MKPPYFIIKPMVFKTLMKNHTGSHVVLTPLELDWSEIHTSHATSQAVHGLRPPVESASQALQSCAEQREHMSAGGQAFLVFLKIKRKFQLTCLPFITKISIL